MNIQVHPTRSNLAFAMLNSKIRPRAVVGYGVKIFHPSPPNYVTRSPGSAEVIIAGGQIFKMAASRFVDVSEEEINLIKENAIPRNTKHATKFGMTLFKGKM